MTVDLGSRGGSDNPITITAPKPGETVAGGVPYTIRWTATSEVASDGTRVSYSTDNGSTWPTILECNNSGTPLIIGQCTWHNPGPATTQALLKVCDADPEDGCGSTGPFTITWPSNPPYPWQHADVGKVGAAGAASYDSLLDNGDAYAVTGAGADIWGTAADR